MIQVSRGVLLINFSGCLTSDITVCHASKRVDLKCTHVRHVHHKTPILIHDLEIKSVILSAVRQTLLHLFPHLVLFDELFHPCGEVVYR